MSKELDRMLRDHNKGVQDARDPLARLYRQILADIRMSPLDLHNHIINWLNDPRNGIPDNTKIKSTERGNIIQELTRPNMTLKVFIKRLRLLPIAHLRLSAEITWRDRKTSKHSVDVQLNEFGVDDEPTPPV